MTVQEDYERIVQSLVGEARALYGDRLVACAVFGSVGRRAPHPGSDVDILIVARALPDGPPPRFREFQPVEAALEPLLREVGLPGAPVLLSPVFKTPAEAEAGSPLFFDMTEDARILYDTEGFLAGRLERLRARLRQLGSRRIWRGSAWYWDLKPDFKPGEVISFD
jgi:predicted nucleotidyltransferase